MSRLIEVDALDRAMYHKSFETDDGRQKWDSGLWIRYKIYEETRDETPTVDAVPVRHGKWIIRDNPRTEWYRITCSECGEDVTSTAPCIGFFPNASVTWDYCPNCGAKMDAERREHETH